MPRRATFRLAVDVGGTFTDFALLNESTGQTLVGKVLSTPQDISEAVVRGLDAMRTKVGVRASDISLILHATTVATNAVLEGKGVRTFLLTTAGFRDVLEIARQRRIDLFDSFVDRPRPLVPRHARLEVNERIRSNGEEITPLDEEQLRHALKPLSRNGIESIAIVFLHSYVNPSHERRAAEIVTEELPDVLISLSSDILPEYREYERMSTTVINAVVQPTTQRYLERLQRRLDECGYSAPVMVMHSGGGVMDVANAARYPVKIIESGPCAGTLLTAHVGQMVSTSRLISLDMGGTTAKLCLLPNGEPTRTSEFEVGGNRRVRGSGYPLSMPVMDLMEIGAGGGSIARAELGLLKVGPDSAGASPGPACYGLGGTEPTVTDADLILGYLGENSFLGGEMRIDREKAREAIRARVARTLGLAVEECAAGIYEVVNASMTRAMHVVSVERGYDPRDFTLVAFGGAGPMHAARLAEALGIRRVVVPMAAGVASSLGLLVSDVKLESSRTWAVRLNEISLKDAERVFREMEQAIRFRMPQVSEWTFNRSVDLRYEGQGYELNVPFPQEERDSLPLTADQFHVAHLRRYSFDLRDQVVQAVNWRVTGSALISRPTLHLSQTHGTLTTTPTRSVHFAEYGKYVDCPVYARASLAPGQRIAGPAIIEERECTTVVTPRAIASLDPFGNLNLVWEE